MKRIAYFIFLLIIVCSQLILGAQTIPSIVILGTVQDAGAPQMGCEKDCCKSLFETPNPNLQVVSLGLVTETGQKFLFEATPNIALQMKSLSQFPVQGEKQSPDGIFLTHAHIGHYTGLMHFGKEVMNAKEVPVYAMPKMSQFLVENGPWSQLVRDKNVLLKTLTNETPVSISKSITIIPILVPHRDEFSETVGFKIVGPNKSALFIPDIDKWEKWDKDIIEEIKNVDYAFLDATFFDAAEINNRDISEIPHPFVIESMRKFELLTAEGKQKVIFIHFNHTNPLLKENSEAYQNVLKAGFRVGVYKDVFDL